MIKLERFFFSLETNPNQTKAGKHVCVEMLCSQTSYQHKISVSKNGSDIVVTLLCVVGRSDGP